MTTNQTTAQPAAEKATPQTANDLIAQVKCMLEREAYHYCADCHTHCRQTIMAVEALKESERLRRAQSTAFAALEKAARNAFAVLEIDQRLRSVDEERDVATTLYAALAEVERLRGETS